MNKRKFKIALIIFSSTIFLAILTLIFIITFSIYPKYILKANYGKIYTTGQKISNNILSILHFDKAKSPVWEPKDFPNPIKINQPFYYSIKSQNLPNSIYIHKGLDEYLYHSPMIPDPYVTFALLPGKFLTCENSIQQFRYHEILKKKSKNEFRIFITGGSTAWGALAPNNESTIGGFLEEMLFYYYPNKEIKVITAAAGAWNSTQERIWIFNRITEFEPDLIISYSGHNDVFDVYLKNADIYNNYWYDGEYFLNAISEYEGFNRGRKIKDRIKNFKEYQKNIHEKDFPRKTLKNVEIINAYLSLIHCKYLYVLQPIRQTDRNSIEYIYEKIAKQLKKIDSKSENFIFINHSDLFDNRNDIFYDRCHLGDKGYKIIAENLFMNLKKNNLLPN